MMKISNSRSLEEVEIMKNHKLLSLILALALLAAALPLSVSAAGKKEISGYDKAYHIQQDDGSFMSQFVFGGSTPGEVIVYHGKVIKVSDSLKGLYPKDTYIIKATGASGEYFYKHFHEFEFHTTRSGHGTACSCGQWHTMLPHDDPLTAKDGRCRCGYQYYDNAQITVLWMRNVALSPRFSKDKYEYTGKLLADVDEISLVTVNLFDEMATLEQPESYILRPGTNVFEFKVTAEDGKTTQTYTVTIEK